MKNKLKVLIMLICVMCLCGCGNKEKKAITPKEFLAPIEKTFTVNDITEEYSFANQAYLASYQDGAIKLIYAKGDSTYDIRSVFADEVTNVLTQMSKTDDTDTSKGDNWEKLVASNDNYYYYYLIRVDNTYIYSFATKQEKANLKKILKEYGYR